MHSKVRNIPRNTQLRGRLFDKWPRKGLSGACCGPSGEVSGAPTGRGPACSAARDGGGPPTTAPAPQRQQQGQRVQQRGTGVEPACSAVEPGAGPACSAARDRGGTSTTAPASQRPRRGQRVLRRGTGAGRPQPTRLPKGSSGASVFSGAGRGRDGEGSAVRDGGGVGGGAGGSAVEPGGGTGGGSAVQPGRDGPAAGTKKRVPRERSAAAGTQKELQRKGAPPPEHIRAQKKRTSVRPLLLCYSATLRASAPGCSSDAPRRTTTVPHSGSPSLLRDTSGSMFSCNSLSAFDFGLPSVRGPSLRRQNLSSPLLTAASRSSSLLSRPPSGSQPLSRPGSQFSAVRGLGRPRSRPSAARNLPSLLLAPSAAGVTAPPRQYGRPPATGESPASSLRRASPARDSTAYRPAP